MTSGITQHDIDGVPTLMAPRSDERVAAGLVFRVGRADETLATSGITHLVEHLALHGQGVSDLHYNGATADLFTHFHVEGTEAEVTKYLNGVCAALRDLPVVRLETEREILRTESAGRGSWPGRSAAGYRYGAQGYGLSTYPELGLPRLDASAVRAWAGSHFTRDNAALWVSGKTIPAGLDLSLPSGDRKMPPEVTSALPVTPAWYYTPTDVVYADSVMERSTATKVFSLVLNRALFQDLRQRGGLSYSAGATYSPRDRDHAIVALSADCLPNTRSAVLGGVIDTLARLRLGTVADVELESAKTLAMKVLDAPEFEAQSLPSHAVNLLIGRDDRDANVSRESIRRLTSTDMQAVAQSFYASLLVQVPALGLDWAGVDRAPESSPVRVEGREFPPRGGEGSRLVVGPEGVSAISDELTGTVRFADAVLLQSFPDGGRRLIGSDGIEVAVEPTLHELDEQAIQDIDRGVPSEVVVVQPPRPAEAIPSAAPARPLPEPRPKASLWTWLGFGALCLVTAFQILVVINATSKAGNSSSDAGGAVIIWIIFVILVWATVSLWRRIRRRTE